MEMIALFDAQCSLCQNTKRLFQKLDIGKKVTWMSLQEYERKGFSPQFKAVDLRREIHMINPDGKVLVGYWAVRRLLLLSPITCLFGLVLHLPFVHLIGNRVYRLIAKNRYKLNKRNCEDNSCSLFEE